MRSLVYGHDDLIVPWICNELKIVNPFPCVAIGVSKDNYLVGAALYNNMQNSFNGRPLSIEISFMTIDSAWASRAIIYGLLAYPFCQLRVKRVQSTVSKRNKRVRLFLERLGFKYEGTGRQAWPQGGDACVYSMLSGEFFSSKWNMNNGQKHTISPSSARSQCNVSGPDAIQ